MKRGLKSEMVPRIYLLESMLIVVVNRSCNVYFSHLSHLFTTHIRLCLPTNQRSIIVIITIIIINQSLNQVDDLVSRVLGGGVENRWQTRLKPTEEWLQHRLEHRLEKVGADTLDSFFTYAMKQKHQRGGGGEVREEEEDGGQGAASTIMIMERLHWLVQQGRFFCELEKRSRKENSNLVNEQQK
jgi:hypothetical protein